MMYNYVLSYLTWTAQSVNGNMSRAAMLTSRLLRTVSDITVSRVSGSKKQTIISKNYRKQNLIEF